MDVHFASHTTSYDYPQALDKHTHDALTSFVVKMLFLYEVSGSRTQLVVTNTEPGKLAASMVRREQNKTYTCSIVSDGLSADNEHMCVSIADLLGRQTNIHHTTSKREENALTSRRLKLAGLVETADKVEEAQETR